MEWWERLSGAELNERSREQFGHELERRGMRVYARSRQPLEVYDTSRRHWELVVRSSRRNSYCYVEKRSFPLGDQRLVGLAQYQAGAADPLLLLIPLRLWDAPWGRLHEVLKQRNYEGKASEPEWGIDSQRHLLTPFRLEEVVSASGTFVFPVGP